MSAELSAAMAKAFAQIEGAVKGKTNPAFRSKYADLAAVVDAVKPALAEFGLWFRQVTHNVEGGVCVETVIHHASGESLSCGQLYVPATKQDAQGYGSALTYARRYSLMAAFGVPAEDDDGGAASGTARQTVPARDDAPDAPEELLDAADSAARDGLIAYQAFWGDLAAENRKLIGPKRHEAYKAIATKAQRLGNAQ
jgi:hypothetical protein